MALFLTKWRFFQNHLPKLYNVANSNYSKISKEKEYKRCFKVLEIDESSDPEQIRMAYLQLVKRFHPDSGTEEANVEKFHEIDKAFKTIMHKKSKEKSSSEETIEEQDIQHTAPQHRQYLSFNGIGSGNPFQREKQYVKVRAMKAIENVYNHRVAKVTADDKALMEKVPLKHKIKTKYGFDRLVEDLIQESISKGEFNNLKNTGKPLPDHQNRNPYVDFITHKLNEVLIDNGFTPEWILLQKEIRLETADLRKSLFTERKYFGPYPISVEENIEWSEKVYKYKKTVEDINKKIAKFNLVVPVLNKQMLEICLEKEAQKAMVLGEGYKDARQDNKQKYLTRTNTDSINFLSIFDFIFKPK
ncbi:unnamed protein product [Ceutorhynchus assimilis]|uniref:J domain-containing protein n=1 Tax=Ceutorhynchus assimilis TaxID=467358 RepID=A0A9N9QSI5_9CUCU|nr:unnamed protein product [Ceutorhynchus assimilis]